MAIWGAGEVVTIQYCLDGTEVPQIWRGVISQDQSLLNPVTTTPEITTAAVESPAPLTNEGTGVTNAVAPQGNPAVDVEMNEGTTTSEESKQELVKLADNVENPIRRIADGKTLAKRITKSVRSVLTRPISTHAPT